MPDRPVSITLRLKPLTPSLAPCPAPRCSGSQEVPRPRRARTISPDVNRTCHVCVTVTRSRLRDVWWVPRTCDTHIRLTQLGARPKAFAGRLYIRGLPQLTAIRVRAVPALQPSCTQPPPLRCRFEAAQSSFHLYCYAMDRFVKTSKTNKRHQPRATSEPAPGPEPPHPALPGRSLDPRS
jgi:hypothetical protein